MIPCENSVPWVEAVSDFVGHVGKQVRPSKSSAEGRARDVKNFRGASFSFGSFSFGRAKENEHQSLLQLATGFFIDHFYVERLLLMEGVETHLASLGFLVHELSTTRRVVRLVEKLVAISFLSREPARGNWNLERCWYEGCAPTLATRTSRTQRGQRLRLCGRERVQREDQ